MSGLRNSNFQDNEIVKASDVQLVGDVSIENLGKAMKTLFGSTKSVVIGGKIKKYSGGSGLVAVLSPVIGIRGGEETVFVSENGEFYPEDSVEPSSIITFPNSGTSARRDIVEVRAEVITTNEQSRQFYDPETESSSYSQTDVEQRQILRLKIKKGTNGSDTAPATDSGFVKIAEVLIPANATVIEDSNIFNVTADIEGIDNANWTNDKQITINPGTLSDISAKFRSIHNSNGSLKDSVIAASKIILNGAGALQGDAIQKGGDKETIDGTEVAATTSISDFIKKIVARLNKTWEVANGGTGATTVAGARNNLGLGNTAGPLPVANGGTGADTCDTCPTANSTKMVTSGGVYTAISTAETNAKKLCNATGILAVANGGTGTNTLTQAANDLINCLTTGSSDPTDNDYYIAQYAGGGENTITYHRRPHSALWNYIKGKISSGLGLTATSYSGKASTAGTADNAGNASKLGAYTEAGLNNILVGSKTPTVYQTKKAYAVGDYVWYNNKLYKCITAVAATSTTWESAKWVEVVPLPISVNSATSASCATKLSTARSLCVALGSATTVTFDGSNNQNNIPVSGTLGIGNGGTGATTVAGARNSLGLGNTAGALPVANGGTGATDAATARTNLGLGSAATCAATAFLGATAKACCAGTADRAMELRALNHEVIMGGAVLLSSTSITNATICLGSGSDYCAIVSTGNIPAACDNHYIPAVKHVPLLKCGGSYANVYLCISGASTTSPIYYQLAYVTEAGGRSLGLVRGCVTSGSKTCIGCTCCSLNATAHLYLSRREVCLNLYSPIMWICCAPLISTYN